MAPSRLADAAPIEVRSLSKRFGPVQALHEVDFTVTPGRLTGLLGPSGAGKTTTLRILLGLVRPSSGTATIGGRRYRELRRPLQSVGAVLESTGFPAARKGRDHLTICARAAGIPARRVDEVLEMVGLAPVGRRPVGGYSLGTRQRLALATALLGDPPVLVLDEPANGLDPAGMTWLHDLLRHLTREGRTVLVSSPFLAEMAVSLDDVVIIAGGEVRAAGPLSELTSRVQSAMRVRTPEADRLSGLLTAAHWPFRRLSHDLVLVDGVAATELGPVLARAQIEVSEVLSQNVDLETVFLSLTQTEAGVGAEGVETPTGET